METADIINREMTFYERVNQGKSNKTICLFDALNMIRKGEFQKEVTKVRELKIKDNIKGYRAYKKKLPAFLFTGICGERRRKREIIFYTYFLIIDIDHVKGRIDIIRNQLKLDPFIISCWVSPSGEGLKALVELAYPENIDERNIWIYHEHCAFPQVAEYLFDKYAITVDQSGKDITRLCFFSYDPHIHLKKSYEAFPVTVTISK